jgi:hypothetical protein
MRMQLAVQVREDLVSGKIVARRPAVVDIVRSCRWLVAIQNPVAVRSRKRWQMNKNRRHAVSDRTRLLLSKGSRDSASNLGVAGRRVRQDHASRIGYSVNRAVTLPRKDSLSNDAQSTATVQRHHFNIFIEVQKFAHATVWVR